MKSKEHKTTVTLQEIVRYGPCPEQLRWFEKTFKVSKAKGFTKPIYIADVMFEAYAQAYNIIPRIPAAAVSGGNIDWLSSRWRPAPQTRAKNGKKKGLTLAEAIKRTEYSKLAATLVQMKKDRHEVGDIHGLNLGYLYCPDLDNPNDPEQLLYAHLTDSEFEVPEEPNGNPATFGAATTKLNGRRATKPQVAAYFNQLYPKTKGGRR